MLRLKVGMPCLVCLRLIQDFSALLLSEDHPRENHEIVWPDLPYCHETISYCETAAHWPCLNPYFPQTTNRHLRPTFSSIDKHSIPRNNCWSRYARNNWIDNGAAPGVN